MMCIGNKKMIGRAALKKMQLLAYLLLLFLSTADNAFAQTWKAGRSSLMKNDFKTAKFQLIAALKKSRPGQELAETYKYLGVAHYMSGDRNSAMQAFRMAKSNNPGVRLTANEVLDESVIPLFNQANSNRSPANSGRSRTGISKAAAQALPKQNQTSGPAISRQKSKRTLLKVVSNVPAAAVSIDGINYGTAGQELEVSPGTVILEVAANGFKTKAIKVNLQPLTSSLVSVNLDKIIIAPKPKPVPKNIPLTQAKIPLPGQPKSSVGKKSPGKSNDLFGDDPMAGQTFSAMPPPAPVPQVVTPPPAPAQPVMPPQGYGQPPAGYVMPPQYAPSPYPVYPQYAPMQPYGAPVYPTAPYGGYMAPPNPYAYPPAPAPAPYAPAPMADPYGGYLGPPPEASLGDPGVAPLADGPAASGGGMPPPPIMPTDPAPKAKSKSVAQDKCGMIRLLPFGAGQFCNGSTLKGAAFLGGQVAALYFYRTNASAAVTNKTKLNAYLKAREVEKETTEQTPEDYDAETIQTEKQANDVIDKANQNAQFSMVSFVGLWGIGVLDAYINKPIKTNKKKTKKPRIMYSYDLDLDTAPLGTWAVAIPNSNISSRTYIPNEYRLGYTPVVDKETNKLLHSVTFGLTLDL